MSAFGFYIIIALIVLAMIVSIHFKPSWKWMNLTLFMVHISYRLYEICTDSIFDGFVPTVLTISLILMHFGSVLASFLVKKDRE